MDSPRQLPHLGETSGDGYWSGALMPSPSRSRGHLSHLG